jgi:hypothetical protein
MQRILPGSHTIERTLSDAHAGTRPIAYYESPMLSRHRPVLRRPEWPVTWPLDNIKVIASKLGSFMSRRLRFTLARFRSFSA